MTSPGSLSHIRVLDLSRILAGPFCTQMLGDLGADVVKVERPGCGDDTRGWGPPFDASGMSAYFASANRNKRSIELDLKSELGREAVRRLAAHSDVVVENFKAGHLEALGLGYDVLAGINPRLVFCSITGYGATGPRRDEPGYDFLVQAMGGLMAITGEPDGEPMKVGVAVSDLFAGTLAAVSILAALAGREVSGKGQRIDMSLYDAQLAMLANVASSHLFTQTEPRRYGNAHPNIVPYQTLAARDGRFALALGSDSQWAALCRELDREDLASSADIATNAGRVISRTTLIPDLERSFAELNVEECIAVCSRAGVPAGPVRGVSEAFRDAQTAARGMIVEMHRDDGSTVPTVGSPLALVDTPPTYRRPPPRLGEHTDEVLHEIGLDRTNA